MKKIRNVFPGVVANDEVDFEIQAGEIRALVGENGAGKTTLMRTLYGMQKPDAGEIFVKGEQQQIRSPHDAIRLGFGMIHQHFMLVPGFNAVENIILGVAPRRTLVFTDMRIARERIAGLAERYNLRVPLDVNVQDLSVGNLQRIEILKALYRSISLLILDEPTAILTPQEADGLFRMIREFAAAGGSVVFISHKLREVKAIAQTITVMRKGKVVATRESKDVSQHEIARLMVGREVLFQVRKNAAKPGKILLEITDLCAQSARGTPALRGVNMQVRAGEIVGIAGVEGNGQRELAECIAGMWPATRGEIAFSNTSIAGMSVFRRRMMGIGYIPEDRLLTGLCQDMSLWENLVISNHTEAKYSIGHGLLLRHRNIEKFSRQLIADYSIKVGDHKAIVKTFSGGNLQKVVIAREISRAPSLLVIAQPTRGLDMGAVEFIHETLVTLRDRGCGILMVSADLDEIMNLSDRVLVMYEGTVVGEAAAAPFDEKQIGYWMAGLRQGAS
ncbi:MAG: ABC transporter ATP-binding protein [Spirochaetia bacterium]